MNNGVLEGPTEQAFGLLVQTFLHAKLEQQVKFLIAIWRFGQFKVWNFKVFIRMRL
jgi:hypothetical protein